MRSPSSVYLVRHGAVDAAWEGRIYGALDVPLSPHGIQEAERAARLLAAVPFACVVSSGLRRAEAGAALLRAPRELARLDDPELRELERGAWTGMSREELELRWPGAFAAWMESPATERPPGGESLRDLQARVVPRIEHWVRRHPDQVLAFVTHGWVIRTLICLALDAELDLAPRLDVRTGAVIALHWPDAGRPRLDGFALDADRPLPEPQLSE